MLCVWRAGPGNSTVKAAIRSGLDESLMLKEIKEFESFMKETLDLELKDTTLDYRFL